MCTLIALHRCVPGLPLVVAANRDEFFDRPAEGPALRRAPWGTMLSPLAQRAGGTWLALSPSGVFAAVTNRRCPEPDPTRRSRGWLVVEALAGATAAEAAERIAALPRAAYNPFNFFVADRETAHAFSYEDAPRRLDLAPGAHVVGNADPDSRATPKMARLCEQADKAAMQPRERVVDHLADVCRSHDGGGDPLLDTCVHAGAYGTRSSMVLALGDSLHEGELGWADGAPCGAEFRDLSPLLRVLGRHAPPAGGESNARKVS